MSLEPERPAPVGPPDATVPPSRRAWLAATDEPDLAVRTRDVAPPRPAAAEPVLPAQGRDLVAALVDQLAAGQVETLHSLQTVGASVRRQTAELQVAAVAPVQQLAALLERLQVLQSSLYSAGVGVLGDVTTQLDDIAALRLDAVRDALVVPVQPLADLLQRVQDLQVSTAGVVDGVADRLTDRLDAMVEQRVRQANEATTAPVEPLLALTEDLVALQSSLADAANTVVDQVTDRLATRLHAMVEQHLAAAGVALAASTAAATATATAALAAATDALAAATADSVEQLTRAGAAVDLAGARMDARLTDAADRTVALFDGLTDNLVSVSLEALDGVEHANRSLVSGLTTRTELFVQTLGEALERQTVRDTHVEEEHSERLRKLVDRTDVGVRRLTERLRKETDRLSLRDEEQERLRADSFVGALETLLSQSGNRGQLRGRILEVLGAERRKRDAPRPPGAPVVPEPYELAEPDRARDDAPPASPEAVSPVPLTILPPRAVTPRSVTSKVAPSSAAPTVASRAAAPRATTPPRAATPLALPTKIAVRAVPVAKPPVGKPPVGKLPVAKPSVVRPKAPAPRQTAAQKQESTS